MAGKLNPLNPHIVDSPRVTTRGEWVYGMFGQRRANKISQMNLGALGVLRRASTPTRHLLHRLLHQHPPPNHLRQQRVNLRRSPLNPHLRPKTTMMKRRRSAVSAAIPIQKISVLSSDATSAEYGSTTYAWESQ